MAIRNDTILAGLQQERARLLEALKPIDTKTLQAQLTTVEQAIAIYEPRVTEQAKNRQPKTLKAFKQIRNLQKGNGQQPHLTKKQQKIANMIATLRNPTRGRNLTIYVNHGYLKKSADGGNYLVTAKGKHKLAELTESATHDTGSGN